MLVEEIGMFGSTRTNLCGSVLVADRCLWIGEFQPWWIGAWIVACDREWRERVLDGEWRERVSNHEWREREREREFQTMNGERERERELR